MTDSMRVLTYNIHKGFTRGNRQYALADMREAIRKVQADVVALQEVVGEHQKHARNFHDWHHEAHFEFLADQVWPHFAYGKNAIYQAGHHGNALLSKYPFRQITNQDISQSVYSRRSILHGDIHVACLNRDIHVACVHLGFLPYEQYRQWHLLSAWLRALPAEDAVILMGDFNDWHMRIHSRLRRKHKLREATSEIQGKLLATYPANRPRLALDRIYYRGLHLRSSCVYHGSIWEQLSDHCPVMAEFSRSP